MAPPVPPRRDPVARPVSLHWDPIAPTVSLHWDPIAPPVSLPQDPMAPPLSPPWDSAVPLVSFPRDPMVTPVSSPRDPAAPPVSAPRDSAAPPLSPPRSPAARPVSPYRDPAAALTPAPVRRATEPLFVRLIHLCPVSRPGSHCQHRRCRSLPGTSIHCTARRFATACKRASQLPHSPVVVTFIFSAVFCVIFSLGCASMRCTSIILHTFTATASAAP